jgi:hypothetical protein
LVLHWNEPDGGRRQKSFGIGPDGKRLAQMHADTLNKQFATQSYEDGKPDHTTWDDFVSEFDKLHLSKKRPGTRLGYLDSLTAFARILRLDGKPLSRVTSEAVARFVAKRLGEPGRRRKVTTSPANVWLHPFVVDHLKPLRTSLTEPLVFPLEKSQKRLQFVFNTIQRAAGIRVE